MRIVLALVLLGTVLGVCQQASAGSSGGALGTLTTGVGVAGAGPERELELHASGAVADVATTFRPSQVAELAAWADGLIGEPCPRNAADMDIDAASLRWDASGQETLILGVGAFAHSARAPLSEEVAALRVCTYLTAGERTAFEENYLGDRYAAAASAEVYASGAVERE